MQFEAGIGAFSMWKADPPLNPSGARRPMEFWVGIGRFQCRKPTRPVTLLEPTEQWNSGWVLGAFHVDSRPAPSPSLNQQHNAIRGRYWAFSMWKADPPLNPSGARRPMEFWVGIGLFQCRKPTRPFTLLEPTKQWNSGWVLAFSWAFRCRKPTVPFLNRQNNEIQGGY